MSSYEEYLETHGGRKPHGCLRIFGRVFLVLTLGLIAFMIGFVIFRSYEQEPHGDLARFMWTERTAAVATADGTAAALSIEPQVNYTPDKYFLVYNVVRVPESGELQLTVAYNLNRLGREARESGEDSSVYLSEDELPFIFILYDSDGNIYDEFDYLLQVKHFQRIGTSVIGNGDGALVPWQELVILSDSAAVEDYEFDKDELYSGQPAAGLSHEADAVEAKRVLRSAAAESGSALPGDMTPDETETEDAPLAEATTADGQA